MSSEQEPVSKVIPLRMADFNLCMDRLRPQIGNYDWMWRILRVRARQTGYPPHKLFPLMRRFTQAARPYFIGRMANGVQFVGNVHDDYSLGKLLSPTLHEPLIDFIIGKMKESSGAYLDIGTNMGVIAATVALALPDKPIFAFEPGPETGMRAMATFALNKLNNVTLYGCAVGDSDAGLTFYNAPGHSDYASANPTETGIGVVWEETHVECRKLDTLYEAIGPVSAIKIDVEGHELKVVQGAQALLAAERPHIALEYNHRIAPKIGWRAVDIVPVVNAATPYTIHTLEDDLTLSAFPPPTRDSGVVNLYCQPKS
jgi:FkbM family methyltransferase